MITGYYYDSEALSSQISSLQTKLEEYSEQVNNISTLKDNIEMSNEWIQGTVKEPFVLKYEEYLVFYVGFLAKLEAHINYLKNKNSAMSSLEEAYARRS